MGDAKILGGYFILARKIIDSEIMKKPPLYMKVWIYLLARAQHSQYNQLKRGQVRTSIPEIQEACSWYVGARKQTPTKREIQVILDWMRGKSRKPVEQSTNVTSNSPMIVTTKVTHGLIITIENYDVYQSPSNYERYNENVNERTNETSSNSQETLQYKQECIKNVQESTNDDNDYWSNIDNMELTPEQKLENEIEAYYQLKKGKPDWPATTKDREWIKQAMREGFTRDEMIAGITKAFLDAGEVNSFEYCLKVMRTQRKQREKWKAMKQQRRMQDGNIGGHHEPIAGGNGKQTKGKWDHLVIG